jgi:hypothetical protein
MSAARPLFHRKRKVHARSCYVANVPKSAVSNRSKTLALFDHLVGQCQQLVGDFEAERLGGLEVDAARANTRKVQKENPDAPGLQGQKAFEYGSPPLGNEPDLNAGRRTGWGMARAGISMNQAPERQHLAQVDRHIVDLKAHIVRQRVIVKHTRDTGQRSEIAGSLLDALEGSLRIFEKHRELILAQLQRQPYTVGESAASS